MSIDKLPDSVDLVVIGGGITGAGILREGVRAGLNVLLVEQRDFSWGTSSRSSKLVHGGLRYLKEGRFLLTKASVEERCRLMEEAPGLVEKLGFLWPVYQGQSPGRWSLAVGLMLYDLMAGVRQHKYMKKQDFNALMPGLNQEGLKGGFVFHDAQVDDARLVLRLIFEAEKAGGRAANYTRAVDVARDEQGSVTGVVLKDVETGGKKTVATRVAINATGVWAENLHKSPDPGLHIRPLRGSHLMFPQSVLPVTQAVSFMNPADKRPVFAIPWEGATLLGTTDVDHENGLNTDPAITEAEFSLLMRGVRHIFPGRNLKASDVVATFAGVRPVLSAGKKDPSKESREHVVWVDKGLVTITGGKLTTFRRLAWDALRAAKPFFSRNLRDARDAPVFEPPVSVPGDTRGLDAVQWRKLLGRYGARAVDMVAGAQEKDLETIPGTHTIFAELAHAARNEQVVHLDDLLLRRVRMGILCPEGGSQYLDRIQELCGPGLGWDDNRWREERERYLDLWWRSYAPLTLK
ncbi:MAG: glycerol-3-phosphate dehydrogenase/oxidase [Desulfatibacillaceae bacterium]